MRIACENFRWRYWRHCTIKNKIPSLWDFGVEIKKRSTLVVYPKLCVYSRLRTIPLKILLVNFLSKSRKTLPCIWTDIYCLTFVLWSLQNAFHKIKAIWRRRHNNHYFLNGSCSQKLWPIYIHSTRQLFLKLTQSRSHFEPFSVVKFNNATSSNINHLKMWSENCTILGIVSYRVGSHREHGMQGIKALNRCVRFVLSAKSS